MKILISRIDAIGDVILTLPMAGLIKQKYPDAQVLFLANSYTEHIIECSTFVDTFINWAELKDQPEKDKIQFFKQLEIDIFIHVFPNKELARLAYKAGIKTRIGTSHRWFHYLYCNVKEHFSRKKSNWHEAQLNVRLLRSLGISFPQNYKDLTPFMGFNRLPKLEDKWQNQLSKSGQNIILHTKSKGSAREWGFDNFKQLIDMLLKENVKIFLTGTEEEGLLFRKHLLIDDPKVVDVSGQMTLKDLIAFISKADALVAASTGPLHIAAACGIKAIGVYPPVRPMHPLRWAPLGQQAKALSNGNTTCKECAKKEPKCTCMSDVSPELIKKELLN